MNSVRDLAKKMGYNIEEREYSRDKTRCCGAGGMIPYVDLNYTQSWQSGVLMKPPLICLHIALRAVKHLLP